jgi:hypothetical protein
MHLSHASEQHCPEAAHRRSRQQGSRQSPAAINSSACKAHLYVAHPESPACLRRQPRYPSPCLRRAAAKRQRHSLRKPAAGKNQRHIIIHAGCGHAATTQPAQTGCGQEATTQLAPTGCGQEATTHPALDTPRPEGDDTACTHPAAAARQRHSCSKLAAAERQRHSMNHRLRPLGNDTA